MNGDELNALQALLPQCLRQDRRRIELRLQNLLQTRAPAQKSVPLLRRMLKQAERSAATLRWRQLNRPRIHCPPDLPISARQEDIVTAIQAHPVVVIAGETGSGKTTQIPKMCLAAGLGVTGRIGCTQPRRVAALSISKRLAQELHVPWGREVGCKIRFSDQSSPETYIKLMTDGILLAETQGDPDLEEYDVIIIDEAHERSLNIDFLLGYLKTLLTRRTDLKLIITSATIDTELFSRAFDQAPVLEVSGRLYPVEIRYAPQDPAAEESGDLTYIDAAVNAVQRVLGESSRGDILVFMPSERDIRETVDNLQKGQARQADTLPLFGRLSAGDQERVFARSARRKIIVATNIAETSLTIPGIHYVIDPGLARISRYSPRTRTKRLPIEFISQSSANQRAGRSGRVESGLCIRLYAEDEFSAQPRFTQPEIQRANLAEVILRMKAFRLGQIESFPFLNPPSPPAIQSGYQLLQELGALDKQRNLTPLGRDLARLPVDPSIGRMVLESVRENALEEVLIIAAGLSIQDPRERPLDRQEAADLAHRQFQDQHSDFLSLLNIWHTFHDTWESLRTQNQLRKFCLANFLSYRRMREWRDIHAQLRESFDQVMGPTARARARGGNRTRRSSGTAPIGKSVSEAPRSNPGNPAKSTGGSTLNYTGIHRAILAGLLGHVGRRSGRNLYRAVNNREVMVFPGSGLFDRRAQKRLSGKSRTQPEPKEKPPSHQPEWIVAGEILETSRLYARTLAKIDPSWIVQVGQHLCRRHLSDPRWDRRTGRVLARERITLFGLPVRGGWTDYGRAKPQEAADIFIQSALVEEEIDSNHRFLQQNRQVRQRIEAWRTQARRAGLPDPGRKLFEFYKNRLQDVSSVQALDRAVQRQQTDNLDFLCVRETDLTGGESLSWDAAAFPMEINLVGQSVPLDYAYAPGEEEDGVTVTLPATLAHVVQPQMLDWIVPGLREAQIGFLIKALPKALRVALMPTTPKVKALAALLGPNDGFAVLRRLIEENYKVPIPANVLTREMLPDYLRVRISVTGLDRKPVAAGRDLERLKQGLEQHETPGEQKAWARAVQQWERYDLQKWSYGDPPEQIEVTAISGSPLCAFPGLVSEDCAVHLKLFRRREEAERQSRDGWKRLAELALQKELAWVRKDLKALEAVTELYLTLGPPQELTSTAYANLCQHLLQPPDRILPLRKGLFDRRLDQAKSALPDLVPRFLDWVRAILRWRQEILLCKKPYPAMRAGLDSLLPSRFLETVPCERLHHLPRYLRGMLIRAERAALNLSKDKEKASRVQPYEDAVNRWRSIKLTTQSARQTFESFRWLVEEFKISVFAQELGTAQPASAKRLDAVLANLKREHGLEGL